MLSVQTQFSCHRPSEFSSPNKGWIQRECGGGTALTFSCATSEILALGVPKVSLCFHIAPEPREQVLPPWSSLTFLCCWIQQVGREKANPSVHPWALEPCENGRSSQMLPPSAGELRGHCSCGTPSGALADHPLGSELNVHVQLSQSKRECTPLTPFLDPVQVLTYFELRYLLFY